MQGAITTKDVLLHPLAIVMGWGPGCYLRCLRAVACGKRCTFLEIACDRIPAEDSLRSLPAHEA